MRVRANKGSPSRSDEEIQDIVMTANLTPRKCLGFLTPLTASLSKGSQSI